MMYNYGTHGQGDIVALIGVEAVVERNMMDVLDWLSDMIMEHSPPAEIYIADMKAMNEEGDLESFGVHDSPFCMQGGSQ